MKRKRGVNLRSERLVRWIAGLPVFTGPVIILRCRCLTDSATRVWRACSRDAGRPFRFNDIGFTSCCALSAALAYPLLNDEEGIQSRGSKFCENYKLGWTNSDNFHSPGRRRETGLVVVRTALVRPKACSS
jgi:hypothetical protein